MSLSSGFAVRAAAKASRMIASSPGWVEAANIVEWRTKNSESDANSTGSGGGSLTPDLRLTVDPRRYGSMPRSMNLAAERSSWGNSRNICPKTGRHKLGKRLQSAALLSDIRAETHRIGHLTVVMRLGQNSFSKLTSTVGHQRRWKRARTQRRSIGARDAVTPGRSQLATRSRPVT